MSAGGEVLVRLDSELKAVTELKIALAVGQTADWEV